MPRFDVLRGGQGDIAPLLYVYVCSIELASTKRAKSTSSTQNQLEATLNKNLIENDKEYEKALVNDRRHRIIYFGRLHCKMVKFKLPENSLSNH